MKKSFVLWAFLAFAAAVVVNETGALSGKSEEAKMNREEQAFANTLNPENRRTFVKLFSAEQRKHALAKQGMIPNEVVQTLAKEIAVEVVQANNFEETTLVR